MKAIILILLLLMPLAIAQPIAEDNVNSEIVVDCDGGWWCQNVGGGLWYCNSDGICIHHKENYISRTNKNAPAHRHTQHKHTLSTMSLFIYINMYKN